VCAKVMGPGKETPPPWGTVCCCGCWRLRVWLGAHVVHLRWAAAATVKSAAAAVVSAGSGGGGVRVVLLMLLLLLLLFLVLLQGPYPCRDLLQAP
jgi:hypothetical protein